MEKVQSSDNQSPAFDHSWGLDIFVKESYHYFWSNSLVFSLQCVNSDLVHMLNGIYLIDEGE